jgi:asparagine synthase (glutamine-hydrolysing)
MPGIALLFTSSERPPRLESRGREALRELLHYPSYRDEELFQDRHLFLGSATYPGYPLHGAVLGGRFQVFLEGRVYSHSRAQFLAEIEGVCTLLENAARCGSRVEELVRQWDGEYVAVAYDPRSAHLLVFNDGFGRLPIYYSHDGQRLVLAREAKYVAAFLERRGFDRSGVMQYLLFGSPLARTTLLEGVSSLPAATCLRIDGRGSMSITTTLSATERASEAAPRPGKSELARMLADSFLEGLETRVNATTDHAAVVSLSGGLDSRAVLAGLCRLGRSPRAVTLAGQEEQAARRVAQRFDAPLTVIEDRGPASMADYRRFSLLKDGLDCHPDLPRLHHFMESVASLSDEPITYYTGIMGGEFTRHYNVSSGLLSTSDVARHVLDTKAYYKYSTRAVGALLGLRYDEMIEQVVSLLESLPGEKALDKYLSFRHEFYRRYTGEAEDRNRYYCWTITPFYALPFLRIALSMREQQKGLRLWRDVLRCIDPRSCEEPYFNRGISLQSEVALSLFSLAERLIRIAPVKRLAQRLVYLASSARTRLAGDPSPLKPQLSSLLAALQLGNSPFPDAGRIMEDESDPLGIERMAILCSYGLATEMLWART